MRLAIKGHATRGDIVIKTLEMFGGKNSNHCTGSYINRIYFINKNGYIESTDDAKLLLYYSLYSLNEFKIRYPYVINDVVSRKCHPTIKFQISQMKWDDVEECVIYVLNNQLTARVDDLQPYKEETMEDKLEQITFDIPNGYEFFGINDDNQVVLAKKQPQYPKTFIEVLNFWHSDRQIEDDYQRYYKKDLIEKFQDLLYARDAYWKIAGDWEEKRKEKAMHYVIYSSLLGEVVKDTMPNCIANYLLDFPTEEMRDVFYENFIDLINECKDFI